MLRSLQRNASIDNRHTDIAGHAHDIGRLGEEGKWLWFVSHHDDGLGVPWQDLSANERGDRRQHSQAYNNLEHHFKRLLVKLSLLVQIDTAKLAPIFTPFCIIFEEWIGIFLRTNSPPVSSTKSVAKYVTSTFHETDCCCLFRLDVGWMKSCWEDCSYKIMMGIKLDENCSICLGRRMLQIFFDLRPAIASVL